ncbi:hypothetical protein C8Q76DRAFT_791311 [Earliella scabrosa]|nr:hypothetical protein C8Q76DRAFT_791311 [Earliella scabrosa]
MHEGMFDLPATSCRLQPYLVVRVWHGESVPLSLQCFTLTYTSTPQDPHPCFSMTLSYDEHLCVGIRHFARNGVKEFKFELLVQKIAQDVLTGGRALGNRYNDKLHGALAKQKRAGRLRVEYDGEGNELVLLTEVGTAFFAYYGTINPLQGNDRRLNNLNMRELKKRAALYDGILRELVQVFEEYKPNLAGHLELEALPDEIGRCFQRTEELRGQEVLDHDALPTRPRQQ